jgi:hypothetical protein
MEGKQTTSTMTTNTALQFIGLWTPFAKEVGIECCIEIPVNILKATINEVKTNKKLPCILQIILFVQKMMWRFGIPPKIISV